MAVETARKPHLRGNITMAESKLFVGNVEVLALTDSAGDFPFPLSQLLPTVPAEAWAPFQRLYARFAMCFPGADCIVGGRAFRRLAELAGYAPRVAARSLPEKRWNYEP